TLSVASASQHAIAVVDTYDHRPRALARAAEFTHSDVSAARLAGSIAAAPKACSAREVSRTVHDGAMVQPTDPARNAASPVASMERQPSRSVNRPPMSRTTGRS